MKLNIAQALTCLTLVTSWSALAAPVPLQAEVSLSDSVKSWQSAVTDIDDKLQEAMEEHKAFSTKEKWAAGVVGGLSLLGTGGYIASSAIPVAKKKQQAEYLRGLQQAVATAGSSYSKGECGGQPACRIECREGVRWWHRYWKGDSKLESQEIGGGGGRDGIRGGKDSRRRGWRELPQRYQ